MAPTVRLLLPQGGLRRWHESLYGALARGGAEVCADWRPAPVRPVSIALLDELERLLLARSPASSLEPSPAIGALRLDAAPTDFVFDLTGRANPEPGAIFPIYGGVIGEDACDHALLSGAAPSLGLAKQVEGGFAVFAQGLPALPQPHSFRRSKEAVVARLATLVRGLVKRGDGGATLPVASAPVSASAHAFLTKSLAARIASRLTRLVAHEGHWRVAWRRLTSPRDAVAERLAWPDAEWRELEDDRRRYYADPFLFEHDGAVHVFCEEYPYATGKGILSWFPLAPDGRPARAPRPILERPHHLSYPLVFRHAGQIWMLPETCGGHTLELYRADPFPTRWVLDRVLLQDVELSDATFFEHGGRFWLTASERDDGASDWDCLSLFVGVSPLGPWSRCGAGPALVDAAAARPAGRLFERGGALWRPAQDCTSGYGSALALCRIEGVDEGGLAQSVERRLGPPPKLFASGVHTLNVGGGFETIDVVGLRRKTTALLQG